MDRIEHYRKLRGETLRLLALDETEAARKALLQEELFWFDGMTQAERDLVRKEQRVHAWSPQS